MNNKFIIALNFVLAGILFAAIVGFDESTPSLKTMAWTTVLAINLISGAIRLNDLEDKTNV